MKRKASPEKPFQNSREALIFAYDSDYDSGAC